MPDASWPVTRRTVRARAPRLQTGRRGSRRIGRTCFSATRAGTGGTSIRWPSAAASRRPTCAASPVPHRRGRPRKIADARVRTRLITLRPYRPDDAPALLALCRDTIRRVNSRDYSPAQVAAWASDDIDTVVWCGRFNGRFVPVAEEAGRPVGFAELESN